MPFESKRAPLVLTPDNRTELEVLSRSRTAGAAQVERAGMLLAYADGETLSGIARRFGTNRPKVERCLDKALQLGPLAALEDLPGRGRKPQIPLEARTWVVSLACQKPTELGYPYELWTTKLLAQHVRKHCVSQGHPSLEKLARGTVSKILSQNVVRPHKLSYYLERRDPDFDKAMAQVLCVYREVALLRKNGVDDTEVVAYLSYDEKPGIQALENLAPDLPPEPGEHPTVARDYEYKRHGTVTLMAGIDLVTGHVHGQVVDRHRSREFVQFLKELDQYYPERTLIRVILDNHSAHISKETRQYLATVPNRFDFTFTPKHGSWLNLIESFFAKLAKTILRGIRVKSKAELKERLLRHLHDLNESPVVFRWKYGIGDIAVA